MKIKALSPDNNFHNAMMFPLYLSQYFTLFPITGVSKPTDVYLKFSWKSWRILYPSVIITGSLFYIYAELAKMIKVTFNIFELSTMFKSNEHSFVRFIRFFGVPVFMYGRIDSISQIV